MSMSSVTGTVRRAGAASTGMALAALTRTTALLRPARKPLHPDGDLRAARIRRTGSSTRTGVAWLDDPGADEATVRVSRAIGLPDIYPDIHGLAVRLESDGALADLLFASTGRGRALRFVLTPGWGPQDRPMTTLLPYRTSHGPVLLGAFPATPDSYELCWARGAGAWHPFGVLDLGDAAPPREISFDPVHNRLDGLEQYPVVTRLREPAYRSARRSRT